MRNYLALILVFVAALAQGSRLLEVGGVNPNLLIAIFASLSFMVRRAPFYFLCAALGIVVLRFGSYADVTLLALLVVAAAFFIFSKFLTWHALINSLVMALAGTAIFYAVADYAFIISRYDILMMEMVYNAIVAIIFYFLLQLVYEAKE